MAAPCPHRASLPQRALRRQDPRQEPGALVPHAGICPGGRPRGRSLPGLPANPPDKAAAAEAGEERERAKGNAGGKTRPGRSAGPGVSSARDRVRQVARQDKEARFTALLHHVTVHRLMLAFDDLKKDAAPGVDGVTWREYEQDLAANLRDLHERVQSGRYRASPGRRAYIPKADGRQRPGTALVGMFFFLTLFVQDVWGYSALRTGVAYLPFVPAVLATTAIAQQGVSRIGARPLLIAGSVISAGGMFCCPGSPSTAPSPAGCWARSCSSGPAWACCSCPYPWSG